MSHNKVIICNEEFIVPKDNDWDAIFSTMNFNGTPVFDVHRKFKLFSILSKNSDIIFALYLRPFRGGIWQFATLLTINEELVPVFMETLICEKCHFEMLSANPMAYDYFKLENLDCVKALSDSYPQAYCPKCANLLLRPSIWVLPL